MSNGQIGQDKDKKNPFQKETEIPEQETSVFERETDVPSFSQVEGLPSEIPFQEELTFGAAERNIPPDLLRAISQAQATFAPDASSVIPESFLEQAPIGITDKSGVITIDDVFNGEILSTLPIASGAVRDASGFADFQATGIRSLRGPIGRGIIGGTVRMAMNMTEALIKKPAETIIGIIIAIPLLTFKGLQGFIEDTALPNITVAGNEDALELVREKFADIIGATPVIGGGRMSPDQMNEAHRGFKAVLAAAATGRILFAGLRKPVFGAFRQIGVPAKEAVKRSKLLRLQISATGALGTFGAVGGDPEEMEKNFVAFALASIPLGLMFHTFGAIGRTTPKVNNGPGRAMVYQQQRAARPFNQETTVVPEVRVITDPARLLGTGRRGLEVVRGEPIQDIPRLVAVGAKLVEDIFDPFELEPGFDTAKLALGKRPPAVLLFKKGTVITEDIVNKLADAGLNAVQSDRGFFNPTGREPERGFDTGPEIVEEGEVPRPRRELERLFIENAIEEIRREELRELAKPGEVVGEIGPEVELGPKEPKPLEPDVLAERLDNYVDKQGDEVAIIIQNLSNAESGMVVVPGLEVPNTALTLAKEIHGEDAIVAVHLRSDGMFDVAVGRKGSPIDNSNNFKQFTEEGFFAGQKISINGKDLVYIGRSGEQSFVRVPGDPRLIKINTKDIRRPKDVSSKEQKPEIPAEKQLEGVISPEEIEVFKALREEINPVEPSTEPKTFDQIRQEASTNGLDLTRTASNTFIVRDRATGHELFKGATKEDAEAFINNIGQDETVVFDGDVPIDTDIPGSVTPPPSPGLRVNEPTDFPPNTKVGTIIDLFQSLTPFITPFKDWAAATDNLLGTKLFSEVYIKTQETHGRSLASAIPWLKKLQRNVEKRLVDAKIPVERWEMLSDYIETMSVKQMEGDPRKGEGLLKSRRVNENEISAKELILELDIETRRLYEYIRLRSQLFFAEARDLRVSVEDLDPRIKKSIEDEIISKKNMTPNEMAGVQIFDHIRAQDLNDISLYVVSRLVEGERGQSLSRSDFAAKNSMTALEIDIAGEIEQIYSDIANLPDVQIEDAQLIRGYTAHYAEHQTASPENSLLNQSGTSRELRFVNELIRSGEINAYDRNPVSVLARYIKNAFNSVEFNDAWNDAKRYVDTELGGQFGKEGSVASWIAKSYLTDLRGVPGAATKFTQQVVDAFFKKMGWKMELNIRRDLVNTYLAMTNAAFMGARPGLAMRDLMQLSIFHYSRFGGVGGKRTMRMFELAIKLGAEGTKELRDSGELPTIGIVEFETAAQLEASAIGKTIKGLPAMTRKIAEIGLTMSAQRNAYEFGYKGILLEARETALKELTRFSFDEISKEQAYKNIGLDTYNLQTKKAFDTFVSAGDIERAANFLGQQTAREIMGVYGRANHPWGWGTNLGRLITHYGTWSSNALAFTLGGISRGSKKQRLAFATRLGMTQAALAGAGNAVGLNVHSWLLLPGLFFTGGPAVQTAELIITSLTGYGTDKQMARNRIMQLFPAWNDPRSMFIPFSYVMGDLVKALENADNPFEFFGRSFSIPLKKGRSWLDDF